MPQHVNPGSDETLLCTLSHIVAIAAMVVGTDPNSTATLAPNLTLTCDLCATQVLVYRAPNPKYGCYKAGGALSARPR